MQTRLRTRWLATVAVAGLLHVVSAGAFVQPRIVNGLVTHDFPTAGALLYGAGGLPITPDNAVIACSGTLIGCRTFLTAAHCVVGDTDPSHYQVYLQNAGVVAVTGVTYNPSYSGTLSGNDVAVLTLAADVTGVTPTPINATHDLAALGVGFAGTIVGFGQTSVTGRDFGIERYGAVQTANCLPALTGGEGNDKLVCWDFAIPVGPPGQDSDTCNGDSGGPLFIDFGAGLEVVGATSTGSSPFCRPLDHSWDASVYFNAAWIQSQLGTDSTVACGGIGPVGTPAATVIGSDGVLSVALPGAAFTVDLTRTASVLRVALNGQSNSIFNPDLYVKQGLGAGPASYDCKADGLGTFGSCEFVNPAAGTWSIFVAAAAGAGEYQLTTTVFTAPPPPCGNGAVDAGEECDAGAANGTPTSCCSAICQLVPRGMVCRDVLDACDVAETCDGASPTCPADVRLPDTDGDGVCDAIDPCTNVAHEQDFVAAAHPKLTLGKIGADPTAGNDTLALTAAFRLAPGESFAALDPIATGARLLVRNLADVTRIDVRLASGAYGGPHTRGWKKSGALAWTFKDTTATPAGGVTSMQVTDQGKRTPRRVSVTITGKKATYPIAVGDEPLRATIVLGDQPAAVAGACGESAFVAGDCLFNRKRDTLVCKQ